MYLALRSTKSKAKAQITETKQEQLLAIKTAEYEYKNAFINDTAAHDMMAQKGIDETLIQTYLVEWLDARNKVIAKAATDAANSTGA
jgi:hypothetical protein